MQLHAGCDRRPGRLPRAGRAQALQPRPARGGARRRRGGRGHRARCPGWWTYSTACRGPIPSGGSSSTRPGWRVSVSRPPRSRRRRRAALFGRRRRHRARARPAGPDPGAPSRQRSARVDAVERVPIIGPGGWLPLGQLGAGARHPAAPSELLRENLRPYVAVTGRTSGRSLGGVMRRRARRRGGSAAARRGHARDRRPVRQPAGSRSASCSASSRSHSARCCSPGRAVRRAFAAPLARSCRRSARTHRALCSCSASRACRSTCRASWA